MSDSTVTLIMDGAVPLEAFRDGVAAFTELVQALAKKVSPHDPVTWVLEDLQFSSAIATARAQGDETAVRNVVNAYATVGNSLEEKKPSGFGKRIDNTAAKLYDIEVERIRLETAAREAIVRTKFADAEEKIGLQRDDGSSMLEADVLVLPHHGIALKIIRGRKPAFGAVKGRIQTVTNRGSLRFTLFDLQQDRAVSCYFGDGKQDSVRDLWGRLALVEGMVTRDPVTGRPLSIRDVRTINPLPESLGGTAYKRAEGAAPSLLGISAEEAVRRIRDAQ